jgi:two-component system alkaline phosphatase synthesis response regulator PhoP
MELLARVKALLRRTKTEDCQSSDYHVGCLYVCPDKHIVRVDGENITLTRKEFEMLCLLLRNRDIVLSRDQFLNQVWGYSFDGENRTVDVHIRTLRQKLGNAGGYIKTIRGIGYKIGEHSDEE